MSSSPSRRDGGAPSQVTPPQKVFVGNLSYFCAQDDLRQLFAPFGFIKSVSVCRTKALEPLYFGFVFFQEEVEADSAVRAMDGQMFQGRRLRVRNTSSTSSESPTQDPRRDDGIQVVFSFISYQLDLVVTEQVLVTIFQEFGEVVDCVIKSYTRHTAPSSPSSTSGPHTIADAHNVERDRMNRQGGYGFVTFPDIDAAQRAVAEPSCVRQVARPSTPIAFVEIQIDCQLSKGSRMHMQDKTDRGLSPGSERDARIPGGPFRQSPSSGKTSGSGSDSHLRRSFQHPPSDSSQPLQHAPVDSVANDAARQSQHVSESPHPPASSANPFVSHTSRSVYPSSPSIAKLPEGAGMSTAFPSGPQFSFPSQSPADSRQLNTSFAQPLMSQSASAAGANMVLPPSHHISPQQITSTASYSSGPYFPPNHLQPPHGASSFPVSASGAQFAGFSPYESPSAPMMSYGVASNSHVMHPAAPTMPDPRFVPYPPNPMPYPAYAPQGYHNWVYPASFASSMPDNLPTPGYFQQGAAIYPSHYVSAPTFPAQRSTNAPYQAPSSVARHPPVGWQSYSVSAQDERGRPAPLPPQPEYPSRHKRHG